MIICIDCCLVTKLYVSDSNPIECSTPGFPVLHHLPELKLMCTESVMPPNLCHPLLLPPSIFTSQHQGLFQ